MCNVHLPELFKSRNPITLVKFPLVALDFNFFVVSSSTIIEEPRFWVVGFITIVPPPFIFVYPPSGFRGVFGNLLEELSFKLQKSVIFVTFSTAREDLAFFGFTFASGSETFWKVPPQVSWCFANHRSVNETHLLQYYYF